MRRLSSGRLSPAHSWTYRRLERPARVFYGSCAPFVIRSKDSLSINNSAICILVIKQMESLDEKSTGEDQPLVTNE